ncbi:MAG: hypothetical protein NVSMB25_12370 [Thermoleophilaceae bacterium]
MNLRLRDMPRFMREHRWTRAHMSDYIDGEMPDRGTHRVEAHVGLCPPCQQLLESLRRTVEALGELGEVEHDDMVDGVIARLRAGR